jgi:hypothetical protein
METFPEHLIKNQVISMALNSYVVHFFSFVVMVIQIRIFLGRQLESDTGDETDYCHNYRFRLKILRKNGSLKN